MPQTFAQKMKWLIAILALVIGAIYFLIPSSIPWSEEMVRGAYFNSRSENGLLSLNFSSTGNTATGVIGDRNADVSGIVVDWTIDDSGNLILIDDEGSRSVLRLISYTEDSVGVWEFFEGRTRFQRSKNDGEQDEDTKPDNVPS